MFNPTQSHEKEISKGQYKLRLGNRVPKGAVNLAYSYVSPLTPEENVTIADSSSFVLENVAAGREVDYRMWPNEAFLLRNEAGIADIYSQTFMLTDVFENNEPLYYVHRLRYFHYDSTGPDEHGLYQGTTIIVVDENGDEVKGNKLYQVKLIPSSYPKLYYVDVFSNFQTKPGEDYKIIYNAIEMMTNGERSIMTNHSERLNAKSSFTRVPEMDDILSPANTNQPYYYQVESADFGYTKVYIPKRPVKDTRSPVMFRYQIRVKVERPSGDEFLYAPWIDAMVYHVDSLTSDDPPYFNGFTHLSEESAEELVAKYLKDDPRATWLQDFPCEYTVIASTPDAIVDVKPDGKEAVIASTEKPTGKATPPLNYRTYNKKTRIQFSFKVVFVHKRTGETFHGYTSPMHTLDEADKPVDIQILNAAQFMYPPNYVAADWLLLLEPVGSVPVTLSFYHRDKKQYQYPFPCSQLGVGNLAVQAETHHLLKMFAQTYALRPADNKQIEVLKPLGTGQDENWFLRIQNGRFQKSFVNEENLPQGVGYFVPEYYTQGFSTEYGMPYRKVEKEKPKVVGERLLRLRYTPLFITTDPVGNEPNNISVFVNGVQLGIHAWDSSSGILEMIGAVRESDNIEVHYFYQETAYEYRGYYNATERKFIYLDLNPGPGHFSTQWSTGGNYEDLPSYSLINKTIYIYLRAAGDMTNITEMQGERIELNMFNEHNLQYSTLRYYTPTVYTKYGRVTIPNVKDAAAGATSWEFVDDGYVSTTIKINNPQVLKNDYYAIDYMYLGHKYQFENGSFQRNVLFHEFFEIKEENTILLARVQVRPNSTYENIDIIDTRTRGGGLLESIGRNIINEVCPEASSYWDIGYWDGEPYQENSVLVIKLPRYILKEYGGRLTKEEAEEAVNKHMALGTFYIIEYVEDPVSLLDVPNHLIAETVPLEDIKPSALPIPVFKLVVEG